jgi:hypothetical protein
LSIRAVLAIGRPPQACFGDPAGCIIAERTLDYASAKTATVPIGLYRACLGVSCAAGQTCNARGACVSSFLDSSQCTGRDGCILEGDPPTPPGIRSLEPGLDAGSDAPPQPLPALLAPEVFVRDRDPRQGIVDATLQLVPRDASGAVLSYGIDAVNPAGSRAPLAQLDARGPLAHRFLPGTKLPEGFEFVEARARSADGRESPPTRVRLDNYVRRADVGANAGGDALSSPLGAYDAQHNRLMLLGKDLGGRLALRRCNGSGGDCVAVPFDGKDATDATLFLDEVSTEGRLLIVAGSPSLTVFRCMTDGTNCVRTELGAATPTPSVAVDPVSRTLLIAAHRAAPGTGQTRAEVYRCELDTSKCITFVAVAQVTAGELVPRIHVDSAAPAAARILAVRTASGAPVLRCSIDAGSCDEAPGLTGPGELISSAFDATRRVLFSVRNDLRRCDLNSAVCSTISTGGKVDAGVAQVDISTGTLHLVGLRAATTRTVLRCDESACLPVAVPLSLGFGQDVVLGSGPQQGRWLIIVNIVDSTNTTRAWVADCNLQGTDCAMTDASAGNARGNSVAVTDRPIGLAIDGAGRRIFVASTNPSTNNRPALFVCDLEGANCRYEGIQTSTAEGTVSDVGHSPHLLFDSSRDGLLLVTSDQSPGRHGRPGVFLCGSDGKNCAYLYAVPNGAGKGEASSWTVADVSLQGQGTGALTVLATGQGSTAALYSRCSNTAVGCRTRLFNVPANCSAVSLGSKEDRVLATCSSGAVTECDVVSGVCAPMWAGLPSTFLGRAGSGAFFGGFFGHGLEAGANVVACAAPQTECAERWVQNIPGGGSKVTGATALDVKRGTTYVTVSLVQGGQSTALLRCPTNAPCEELARFRCGGAYPFIGATAIPKIDTVNDRLYVAYRDQDNLGRPSILMLDLF